MATTTSSLTRTRSTRAPTNTAKPPLLPSTRTPANNVSLFLTNLRLLDLDLRPDWPDINALTLSNRDAAQGQKKRIQCVEWALYQLLYLWDPEDAHNKLRPFYPPLDQVQSLNLRAALLRSLEQAKKNGVLGRDAVVRKTMLDECRGDRLEEVLAVLSSAVLKKRTAEQDQRDTPLAESVALERQGYSGDKAQLVTLALAHRVSLNNTLRDKQDAGERFHDFADLLRLKERTLLRRKEQVTGDTKQRLSETPKVEAHVRRTAQNSWSGHEPWLDVLLGGDRTREDEVLTTSFDRVWRRVEAGRLGELENSSGTLLEQLNGRVRVQGERLKKWQQFRHKLLSRKAGQIATQTSGQKQREGIELGFGEHENLRVGKASPRKAANTPNTTDEYRDLLHSLEDELESIEKGACRLVPSVRSMKNHGESREMTEDTLSELEDYDNETLEGDAQKTDANLPTPNPRGSPVQCPRKLTVKTRSREIEVIDEKERAIPVPTANLREKPPVKGSPPGSPAPATQEIAEQILESMNATSPSPKKPRHTLSLAERTRLSMARRGSEMLLDEEPDTLTLRHTPTVTLEPVESPNGQDDLVARTRRSMAGFEAAQQRAQLERRRSQRKSKVSTAVLLTRQDESYFPALDEENSALITSEELLAGEQDYESVFMSRPRIKTSPMATPTREIR